MKPKPNRLRRVMELALEVGGRVLDPYSNPKSPQKFTQPQLLACLVLKAYLKTTYRGCVEVLENSPPLVAAIRLKSLPNYSTLQRFAERAVTPELVDRVLGEILVTVKPPIENVAVDSTGVEPTSASAHYVSRSGRRRTQYVKLSVVVVCSSLLPASLAVGWGPCNDKSDAADLLSHAAERIKPKRLFADAGYDAEWVHEFCREYWKTRSYIPPAVHRRDGTVGGRYRSQMLRLPKSYGQRWHVESFMSGLKRTTGAQLSSRKPDLLFAEAAVRTLAYALRR